MAEKKKSSSVEMAATTNETRVLLNVALEANVPILIWGSPGTAKTAIIREDAAARGWHVETLIGSILDPTDISGLPFPDREGKQAKRLLPDFFLRLKHAAERDGGALLFLDEISTCPPATQAAMLRLVAERAICEEVLPDSVRIVAAANSVEEAAGGWTLAPPMANRFCHLQWDLKAEKWIAWMRGLETAKNLPIIRGGLDLDLFFPKVKGLVTAFLQAKPSLLLQVPKTDEEAGLAWPSPRSWAMGVRLMAACEALGGGMSLSSDLLRGAVGTGAAMEFVNWIKVADLPDPEEILANPKNIKVPTRDDVAFSALGGLVAAVATNLTNKRWEAAWTYIGRISEARGVDISAAAARELARIYRSNTEKVTLSKPEEITQFAPLLRALGWLN